MAHNMTPSKKVVKLPVECQVAIANEGFKISHSPEIISQLVYQIRPNSIIIYVLDLTNIEVTMLPELYIALSNKKLEVIFVLNKSDVLPHGTSLPRYSSIF